MLFKEGRGYNTGTKLTGFISSLGEKNPLNSAVWANADDLKFFLAYVTQTGAGVTVNNSEGILSASRLAEGQTRLTLTADVTTFACVPVALAASGAVGSRVYAAVTAATSTTVDITRYDSAGAVEDGSLFALCIGACSATTSITDNSATTPLSANSLNRVMAVGNYRSPSVVADTCWVLSCGITSTNANPGDAVSSIANIASQTRNAAGSYRSVFTTKYIAPPLAFAAPIGGCGYCMVTADIEGVNVRITNGTNATLTDLNYELIVLGEMLVS